MPLVVLVPVALVGAAIVGAAFALTRRSPDFAPGPAAPGTPQLDGRLPVALWPPDGNEPVVEPGIRGWRRMAAYLYHRDTVVDDAALARAIVLANYSRRAADARREIAFEVWVLNGGYEPAAIAAAWLSPQPIGADAEDDRRAFTAFGLGAETLAILEAAAALDLDTGRLAPEWGRQVGLDPAHRDFAAVDRAELDAVGRARLAALMIDGALDRVHARQPKS
jgi:hypothetical protein